MPDETKPDPSKEPRWALYAYHLDEDGDIDDDDRLFVFEDYNAAVETMKIKVKNNKREDVYFDIERGTVADFDDEEEEGAEDEDD